MGKLVVLESRLAQFGGVPFSHGALLPLLAGYRRPNDKIADWLAQGVLLPLRRGLYVVGPVWRKGAVSLPLVANRLHGPSCVSLDYALAWHGLIPERVVEVTSVCMKRGRVMENALGRFSWASLPADVYPVGIRTESVEQGVSFLMASPAKALCDKILLTRHLQVTSRAAMQAFLLEDLRVDPDALANLDRSVVAHYAASGHKPRQLQALHRLLEEWQ